MKEFDIIHEEYNGDEPIKIMGYHFENAALNYAEYYNRDENDLMNEFVEIKVIGDGVEKTFTIGAEPDVCYSATEK